jgi:hypothetical protein
MADEPKAKIETWFPWIVAAVCFVLLMKSKDQESSNEKPVKSITATVKETLPSIRSAYKQAFLDAASKIESGEIKDQETWTKFIEDNAGAKRIEAMNAVYEAIDKLDLPASFVGKEKEIADLNRRIGEAW